MTGIIKTDKIQSSAGNDAVTVASNGSITTSGDVGIGEDSPAQRLEVTEFSNSEFKGIRINNPNGYMGSAGIEFQVDATYSKAAIYQTRAHPNGGGDLIFAVDTATDAANWVAGDEKLRLRKDGGITFNGDTAAANALDDYEEGTWNPEIFINGSATGIVYSSQYGSYVKIGAFVYCWFDVNLSNKGSSSGGVEVRGLPFTSTNGTEGRGTFAVGYYSGFSSLNSAPFGRVESNSARVIISHSDGSGTTGSGSDISNTNVDNNARLQGLITLYSA